MINYNANTNINDVSVLEEIIRRKHKPARQLMSTCEDFIKEDYVLYKRNVHHLECILSDDRIMEEVRQVLMDTYESNPKSLQEVKTKIKEGLPDIVKAKCPYCMISAHSTFDHYLDKATFPEYSLLSLNLIPSCFECNSLKGGKFLNGEGERIFINFIHDALPEYPFLKYKIGFVHSKPCLLDICLEFETVNPVNKIIERHFEELNLYERLATQFENAVSTIISEFKEYAFDKAMVKDILEKRIRTMEKSKGVNYWEVCMMRGLLENDAILDDISN